MILTDDKGITGYFVKSSGYDDIWDEIKKVFITLCHKTSSNNTVKGNHYKCLKNGLSLPFYFESRDQFRQNNSHLACVIEHHTLLAFKKKRKKKKIEVALAFQSSSIPIA